MRRPPGSPAHGRIRLRGSWIHFPLKPHDMALHLPFSFVAGVARRRLQKVFARIGKRAKNGEDTSRAVLERGLGATICRDFYFPYAEKIWAYRRKNSQQRRRIAASPQVFGKWPARHSGCARLKASVLDGFIIRAEIRPISRSIAAAAGALVQRFGLIQLSISCFRHAAPGRVESAGRT